MNLWSKSYFARGSFRACPNSLPRPERYIWTDSRYLKKRVHHRDGHKIYRVLIKETKFSSPKPLTFKRIAGFVTWSIQRLSSPRDWTESSRRRHKIGRYPWPFDLWVYWLREFQLLSLNHLRGWRLGQSSHPAWDARLTFLQSSQNPLKILVKTENFTKINRWGLWWAYKRSLEDKKAYPGEHIRGISLEIHNRDSITKLKQHCIAISSLRERAFWTGLHLTSLLRLTVAPIE
jgi:hypothetical protein